MAPRRIETLDGLRGVAAFVVVLHHTLLGLPALADPYRAVTPVGAGSAVWWAAYTPLHSIWGGGESVLVFFVLSGFVLALPYTEHPVQDWTSYYRRRAIRLYLPTFGALVIAGVARVLVHRPHLANASWWLNERSTPITLRGVINDGLLIFSPGALTGVLWSLRWEVLFSMMLPMFLAIGALLRSARSVALIAFAFTVMSAAPAMHLPANLYFMTIFSLGVALAFRASHLSQLSNRWTGVRAKHVLSIASVSLLMSRWTIAWLASRNPAQHDLVTYVGDALSGLGAASVVLCVYGFASPTGLLVRGPVRWLGRRSFSLYLVHEPIVVSTTFVNHGRVTVASGAIGIALSVCVAELFYRAVEAPSIRLARNSVTRSEPRHSRSISPRVP